jgi:DNA modification methylase
MRQIPSEIFRCECGEDVTGEGGVYHIAAGHKMQDGKPFALCLTDPPYGVHRDKGFGGQQSFGGGNGKAISRRVYPDSWDGERPGKPYFDELLRVSEHAIIFGGNYFADILPQSKHWIVWDKLSTMPTFSDCELAWTNLERNSVKKYTVEWNGLLGREQFRDHPTQKPLKLMLEILADYPGDTVFDSYCGSGTTICAAKKLGRHFLGFEISEEYCKIARERIARIEAQPGLFEKQPEQLKMEI